MSKTKLKWILVLEVCFPKFSFAHRICLQLPGKSLKSVSFLFNLGSRPIEMVHKLMHHLFLCSDIIKLPNSDISDIITSKILPRYFFNVSTSKSVVILNWLCDHLVLMDCPTDHMIQFLSVTPLYSFLWVTKGMSNPLLSSWIPNFNKYLEN